MAIRVIIFLLPVVTLSFDFNLLALKRSFNDKNNVLGNIERGRLIGCKYQNICSIERFCFDDNLFGTCLNELDERKFKYELSLEFTILLEGIMNKLKIDGFHWNDFYTQCSIQSAFTASEFQTNLDLDHCQENSVLINKRDVNDEDITDVQLDKDFPPENYEESNKDNEIMQTLEDMKYRLEKKIDKDTLNSKVRNEEGINPRSNGKEAVSVTRVLYADPQMLKQTMKVAKRRSDEWIWLIFDKKIKENDPQSILNIISNSLNISEKITQFRLSPEKSTIYFKLPQKFYIPSSNVTDFFNHYNTPINGLSIIGTGFGRSILKGSIKEEPVKENENFVVTLIICSVVLFGVILVLICFCIQKFRYKRDKLADIISPRHNDTSTSSYKDLFRVSNNKESALLKSKQGVSRITNKQQSGDPPAVSSPVSTRSSTSSWTDDIPPTTNMDIYTGHMILSYMEKHLKNKDVFQAEWNKLQSYEAEDTKTEIAMKPENESKNRFQEIVPYDKSRVVLKNKRNGDYINASLIIDSDPRLPAYIAAQSPTENTIADFWQMIWEQGIVVIINLTEINEKDIVKYWPKEGSEIYNNYEINLVSEHIWSDEYLVRNFYLKNLENTETKTVTQFHFLNWPLDKLPSSSRTILEFRRKVNKSYRSKSTPILVHCKDGCGRSGTYILLDLILNRVGKGLKEMDLAATLEHLRDQRMHLVKTEEQFEYVLNTISEEVNNILKVLNQ